MTHAEQNAFRLPDELMRAFDSTWKGFASAFGRLPEKIERPEANVKTDYSSEGSRPSQENAHVILRTCSDPILGDGASMTNQKDGCLTLKIRPKSQTKSGTIKAERHGHFRLIAAIGYPPFTIILA